MSEALPNTPQCSYCKFPAFDDPELLMHKSYMTDGLISYSCLDIHGCRSRMDYQLRFERTTIKQLRSILSIRGGK